MSDALSAEYRKAFTVRRRKASATALLCASCGGLVVYWASASPTLGVVLAVLATGATVVLTLGVYILSEPVGESLEEYVELTMHYREHEHRESRSAASDNR